MVSESFSKALLLFLGFFSKFPVGCPWRCAHKTKPCFVTLRTFFRSTAGQVCQNTKWLAVYPARVLLAESLRSFVDNSLKGIEEKGKRKEERVKSKEESGKRKAESGKRKEERGKRKEEGGSWEKFLVSRNMVSFSEHSVNQTLNLRSIKCFRVIAWLFFIDIW